MSILLPSRITRYRVSEVSPTEELMVLGHIYAQVGDYASSILDREHHAIAKMCSSRLNIVVQELIDRGVIVSVDDLYVMSPCEIKETDMNSMTIDELYKLYLQWPKRHNERLVDGREQLTFYYEGRIVRELNRRTTTVLAEQLKVDYCNLTYANELENMSFLFSTPLICCDYMYVYSREAEHTPAELLSLIRLYSNYRNIAERELLVEYVDDALDTIKKAKDKKAIIDLVAEVVNLGREKIIACPKWLDIV